MLDDDEAAGAGTLCRDLCVTEAGLVMRAVGDTMIVSPPLVMTEAELEELAARARKALDLTADALVRAGYRVA